MSRLHVAPIVEGHGEVEAIRILLSRIWTELLGGEYIDVIRPIRFPRSKLIRKEGLTRPLKLALINLASAVESGEPAMVLILLYADRDPACALGPEILRYATEVRSDADLSCVLAVVEYETWFVAAADSLRDYLNLPPADEIPQAPEASRLGKGWIDGHFKGTKYSETVDQPKMTDAMNLSLCRERSPSFDKLCRELEKRMRD